MLQTTILERAMLALGATEYKEVAHKLNTTSSTISNWKSNNGNVPMQYCVQISEKTGVSLDWLILGRGENNAAQQQTQTTPELNSDEIMLLTGWKFLDNDQRDAVFDLIRRLARGENTVKAVQQVINIHGDVAQANAGNGNIENLTMSK